jgi:hypothetical protein
MGNFLMLQVVVKSAQEATQVSFHSLHRSEGQVHRGESSQKKKEETESLVLDHLLWLERVWNTLHSSHLSISLSLFSLSLSP